MGFVKFATELSKRQTLHIFPLISINSWTFICVVGMFHVGRMFDVFSIAFKEILHYFYECGVRRSRLGLAKGCWSKSRGRIDRKHACFLLIPLVPQGKTCGIFVYRKPPARRVVPKSLRLYTPVESRNPLIKFAKRSDHLHNK